MIRVVLSVEPEQAENPFGEDASTTALEPSAFRAMFREDEATSPHLKSMHKSMDVRFLPAATVTVVRSPKGTPAPALHNVQACPPTPAPAPVTSTSPAALRTAMFAKGDKLNRYELGEKLGQGAFGHVYVARDTNLDRAVALKFLNPEHTQNVELLSRFLQEARAAARICHPAIVTVFDFGTVADTGTTADGTTFIAMELLQGESVAERLGRCGRFAPKNAMEIVRQIASALEAAHRAGIIHRDLKPENLHFCPDPAATLGERIKILDFGLAKLKQLASVHTQAASIFGTPAYMSPEHWRGATQIDHRSDVYSLGCILFELLTGRPPFVGSIRDMVVQHQQSPVPSVRGINPDVTFELDGLLQRMLAKDPDRRPQSMSEVQRALEINGARIPGAFETMLPREAEAVTVPTRGQRRRKRSAIPRPLWMLGAVGLVALSIYFTPRPHSAAPVASVTIVQSPPVAPAPAP
jgi:Protein kinase domain